MEKSIFQIPLQVIGRYFFYSKSQWWSERKLDEYQNKMLIKLVRHAAENVPYYRNLFRKIGFDANTFRGKIDMHKIPFLDKEIVRTHKKELLADNAKKFGITHDSTSGSTGTPLHFVLDDSVQANKIAAILRSYHWGGYSLGKRTFSLQSYYFQDKPFHFSPFYNILRFDSNQLKKDAALEVIKEINRLKPKFFMGFPFDLVMLSKFADEAGVTVNPPESIVTYGETLSENKRKLLENAYHCRVFDFYSLHESAAMISECEKGNLHLIEDFAFHEIVDENGNDASERGFGELVGTSYYNFSMPFIRYKTRDIIKIKKENNRCECGRNFRIVEEISGKECDFIQTPDGRFLGAVMSHSIDNAQGVICSQCVQNSLNHITVNIITDKSFNRNSRMELEKGLRKRLGNKIQIELKQVQELEKRKSGKTPFIISKIGNEYF
ncbi:MAG: hypothetical protein DRZ79_03225 [Candidatus Cloacimonadota bacterium]|nr:MAG: hypothetical protein DRZ79_03225 [Candidatus Cloacimonadota bacterium]